ncbi:MAG: hypothetical protein ACRC2Y_05815 [Aeromonas veronii]
MHTKEMESECIDKNQSYLSSPIELQQTQFRTTSSIKSSLDNINKTVGTLPDGAISLSFLSALLGALVASIAAGFVNYLQIKSNAKNRKTSYLANQAKSQIKEFEAASIEYWSTKKDDNNILPMQALETRIISEHQLLLATCDLFSEHITSFNFLYRNCPYLKSLSSYVKSIECDHAILKDFSDTIFEIATGEEFKSMSRAAQPKKASQISRKCSNACVTLLKYIDPV